MLRSPTQRRIAAMACIALIGLGLGLFLALRGLGDDVAIEAPESPVAAVPAPRLQPERPAPAVVPEAAIQPSKTPIDSVEPRAKNEYFRVLEFKLRSGAPATGVDVQVSHHGAGHPRTPETRTETLTTDLSGTITFQFSASVPTFRIRLRSRGWRIADQSRGEEGEWYFGSPGLPTILERIEKMDVVVRYADGVPYDGVLTLLPRGKDDSGVSRTTDRYEVAGGAVQIDALVGEAFVVSVQTRRPGFSGASAESSPEAPLRTGAELVLEYDETDFGIIEVELTAFSPADSLRLMVAETGPNPSSAYGGSVRGGGVHPTTRLAPGEYRVVVREDVDKMSGLRGRLPFKPVSVRLWESGPVTVAAGETVRVVAEARLAGAVRARIVDENGQPLSPAGLFIELGTKRPLDWRYLERNYRDEGMWLHFTPHLADEHGVATQPNVAAGKVTLYAEAPGYDYEHIEVECVSGQVIDIGTIQLQPASGVIDVEIKNWDSGRRYTLDLYPFGGGGLIRSIEVDGPSYRFERLSLRWYSIAPNIAASSQNVRLSPDEPYAKVTFINSAPPPKAE